MDKQIEEMAKDMLGKDYAIVIVQGKTTTLSDNTKKYCQRLIEQGYRKIPDGAVVLTMEQMCEIVSNHNEINRQARRETAETFAERLEEVLVNYVPQRLIDEIVKELTEGAEQ